MIDNVEGLILMILLGNLCFFFVNLYLKNKCEGNEFFKSILKSNCYLFCCVVILVCGFDIWVWEIIF